MSVCHVPEIDIRFFVFTLCVWYLSEESRGSVSEDINSPSATEDTIVHFYIPSATEDIEDLAEDVLKKYYFNRMSLKM